jgi:hypothetical protein
VTRTRELEVFDRDDEVQVGFGRALGLSYDKLGEICGSSRATVHTVAQLEKVQRIERLARAVISQSETRILDDVRESYAARLRTGLTRGLTQSERIMALADRLLDLAEKKGDDATVADLLPIITEMRQFHTAFTGFFVKYNVSEAPRRTQVEGLVKHDVKHTLSLSEADNILRTRRELASAFETPPIDVTPSN